MAASSDSASGATGCAEVALARLRISGEGKAKIVEEAEAAVLVALLRSSDEQQRLVLAELVGDLARVEDNRQVLGKSGVIEVLVSFLKEGQPDLRKFAARALGNLSFEHNENRQLIVQAGAVQLLVEGLTAENELLRRNSAGALANLASENPDIQKQIGAEGAIGPLLRLLSSTDPTVLCMASRALCNLSDAEENQTALLQEGGVAALLAVATAETTDSSARYEAFDAVQSYAFNDRVTEELARIPSGLAAFVRILQRPSGHAAATEEREEQGEDEDEIERVLDTLLVMAEKELPAVRQQMIASGLLSLLIDRLEASNVEHLTKAVKALGYLSLSDEATESLFAHLDLLLAVARSDAVEVSMAATMVIGNLARSDERCIRMVDRGVVPRLLELVDREDVRVRHMAVGALKNLSITEPNRARLVEQGVLPPLIKIIATTGSLQALLLFSAISTVKGLVVADTLAAAFVAAGGIPPLVQLAARDPQEGQERVQFEAARIVAMLIEHGRAEWCSAIAGEGGIKPLVVLVKSDYPLLQCEGAKALARLATLGGDQLRTAILRTSPASVVEALAAKVGSDNPAVALAALIALLALCERAAAGAGAAPAGEADEARGEVRRALGGEAPLEALVAKTTNDGVREAAAKLLKVLKA